MTAILLVIPFLINGAELDQIHVNSDAQDSPLSPSSPCPSLAPPSCFSDNWSSLECSLELSTSNRGDLTFLINHLELVEVANSSKDDSMIFVNHPSDTFFHCEPELHYQIKFGDCSNSGIISGFKIVRPGTMLLKSVKSFPNRTKVIIERNTQLSCFKVFPLTYTIHFTSQWGESQIIHFNNKTQHIEEFLLEHLRPYTSYDLVVVAHPQDTHQASLLSPPLNFTIQTLASVSSQPLISESGFEVSDTGNGTALVTLHWRPTPPHQRNGPNFLYLVNGQHKTEKAIYSQHVSSKDDLWFTLATQNSAGVSDEIRVNVRSASTRRTCVKERISVVVQSQDWSTVLWEAASEEKYEPVIFWCSDHLSDCQTGVEWQQAGHNASVNPPISFPVGSTAKAWKLPAGQRVNHVFISKESTCSDVSPGMELVACIVYTDILDSFQMNKQTSFKVTNITSTTADVTVYVNFCEQHDTTHILLDNLILTYCQLDPTGACIEESEAVFSRRMARLTSLQPAACYSVWGRVETIFNTTINSGERTLLCTPPTLPPTVVSAYLQNNILRLNLQLLKYPSDIAVRIVENGIVLKSAYNRSISFPVHPQLNSLPCLKLEVASCVGRVEGRTVGPAPPTEDACSPWSPQYNVTRTPLAPTISQLHTSGNTGKMGICFSSSVSNFCEAKMWDHIVREHVRVKVDPPSCLEPDCCSHQQRESCRDVELPVQQETCLHFNISIRCGNWIKENKEIIHLYSSWSDWSSFQSVCGTESLDPGILAAIGIGIFAGTVLTAGILFAIFTQVYRFREKMRVLNQVQPGQGIPLVFSENFSPPPYTDSIADQEVSSNTQTTELSLPSYSAYLTSQVVRPPCSQPPAYQTFLPARAIPAAQAGHAPPASLPYDYQRLPIYS